MKKSNKAPLIAAFMAAIFVLPSESLHAQVEVVESTNRLIDTGAAKPQTPQVVDNSAAEAFYQMQLLQQEVSQLRGLVEEQAFEIKRLKQQRLDDYLSMDKRLSALAGGAVVPPVSGGSQSGVSTNANSENSVGSSVEAPSTTHTASADEAKQYRAAIDLILKKKDYAQADKALNQYLIGFPKGRYAANSQYWLGELSLLNGDLESSRQWFARMVKEWPEHTKIADASYKLGTVYHKLGDADKARTILTDVASGNSNAARLASSYLETNLQ